MPTTTHIHVKTVFSQKNLQRRTYHACAQLQPNNTDNLSVVKYTISDMCIHQLQRLYYLMRALLPFHLFKISLTIVSSTSLHYFANRSFHSFLLSHFRNVAWVKTVSVILYRSFFPLHFIYIFTSDKTK